MNEQTAKAASKIRIGDILKIRKKGITLTLKVKGLIEKRVGAQRVKDYCIDQTSPAERILQQERQINAKLYKNHTLKGRPSKRDRRTLNRFKENNF